MGSHRGRHPAGLIPEDSEMNRISHQNALSRDSVVRPAHAGGRFSCHANLAHSFGGWSAHVGNAPSRRSTRRLLREYVAAVGW